MFENIASIDIGTTSIKAVLVKTSFKDFQLKSLAIEDIDTTIEDQNLAIKDALERIIRDNDLKNYKIITNLPMEKAIIRNVSFPFSDVEKIAEAIPFEAEENIPFKLEDLVLDFQSVYSENKDEGRKILLAAAHKETMHNYIKIFNDMELTPVSMGLESNSLYECYRYFNTVEDETVIQLDIGNNKTLFNIVNNNNLQYTRSISIGISEIHKEIISILKCNHIEAIQIFENLNLDLTSFENNVQRGYFKSLGISKQNLKKIYKTTSSIVDELAEQISLTIKAFSVGNHMNIFNRIIISGGGSNLTGIGSQLSNHLEFPVTQLPFLQEYHEKKVQTQFPIAFGTILSYMSKKRNAINFLKGEFLPDIARESKKIYYLAGAFVSAALIIFILNFLITSILTYTSNIQYNDLLQKQFSRVFHTSALTSEPLNEARKLMKKEQKEYNTLKNLLGSDTSLMELMKSIVSQFETTGQFQLKSMIINKTIIRIDGEITTIKDLDAFKTKLDKTLMFDSVNVSIKNSKKDNIRFEILIRKKRKKINKPKRR